MGVSRPHSHTLPRLVDIIYIVVLMHQNGTDQRRFGTRKPVWHHGAHSRRIGEVANASRQCAGNPEPSVRKGILQATDIGHPDYFHKVVDCQWACPAHTPVPEYIRLIAAGRYTDAYMVNWESNVFPGILGRTCDRPCEPACRRGRVEEAQAAKPEPVAICRLKRVTADYKDDITEHLPHIVAAPNGKRIACVGGGPASLTVARDLAPLGYAGRRLRQRSEGRRHDPLADPALSPARGSDRRGDRLRPEARRRVPRRHADRLDEGAARRALGRRLRRLRRAARPRPLDSRAARRRRRTSTSASTGCRRCPSATSRRSASA